MRGSRLTLCVSTSPAATGWKPVITPSAAENQFTPPWWEDKGQIGGEEKGGEGGRIALHASDTNDWNFRTGPRTWCHRGSAGQSQRILFKVITLIRLFISVLIWFPEASLPLQKEMRLQCRNIVTLSDNSEMISSLQKDETRRNDKTEAWTWSLSLPEPSGQM